MPNDKENVKFLYHVVTSNGSPTPDLEAIGQDLGINKKASSKRWSRLKAGMRTGEEPGRSACQYLWLVIKHSQGTQIPNWKEIAATFNTTPGAAAKRYSRMKAAWEKGNGPITPAKKRKCGAAVPSSNKRKKVATTDADNDKHVPSGDEHDDDDAGDDLDIGYKPYKKKSAAKQGTSNITASDSNVIKVTKSEPTTPSPFSVESYTGIQDSSIAVQCPIQQPAVAMKLSDGSLGIHDMFLNVNQQPASSYVPMGFQGQQPVAYYANASQGLTGGEFNVTDSTTYGTRGFQGHQYPPSQAVDSQELVAGVFHDNQLPWYGPSGSQDHHTSSSHPTGSHGFAGFNGFSGGSSTDNHTIRNYTTDSQDLVEAHPNGNINRTHFGSSQDIVDVKPDPENPVQSIGGFFLDQYLDYNEYITTEENPTGELQAQAQACTEAWMKGEHI
ncbi:hypothetical protein DM02DRAFT_697379 [Periconia macrospinosa]|uniref:Myb-like DNA-binding domain-containing protein n=1 Tax=Periconia macrospinosa TaxID=97972 RepID=A0A2V1E1M8_9PLEO|nr:hypothetical protein DM02DRAFT_697379 [Periconia macrospinosa]